MIVGSFGHYSVETTHDQELRRVPVEPRGRLRQGKIYLLDAAANTFDGLFLTAGDSTETGSLASFRACPGQLKRRRPVCVRRLGQHRSGCSGW